MRQDSRGHSVPELIVAVIVTSVLITALMSFTTSSLITYTFAAARADMLSEAQTALDIINTDIRLASSADEQNRWEDLHAPNADSGEYFSWQSDDNTLVLSTAAEDEDGNIIFSDPSQYISAKNNSIYFIEDSVLYKRVLAAPDANNSALTTCPAAQADASCPSDRQMMQGVSSFQLRYADGQDNAVASPNARSVEISITLERTRYGRPLTVSYTTRMVFRNA